MFKKYHYLSRDIHKGSKCYVGLVNNIPVVFCAVLHFPHFKSKNIKRCHRLVVLPDFQGVGIGIRFLTEVAKIYLKDNFRFTITTSQPALTNSLKNSTGFLCTLLKGHRHNQSKWADSNSNSTKRITTSWEYKL